jgi:heme/copper-type cytochrome/quinol oxidase subunit 3
MSNSRNRKNLEISTLIIYFVIQSTFMDSRQSLETLHDIKRMMERSSRFISLSGLSGISAGICALAGAYIANNWITRYKTQDDDKIGDGSAQDLMLRLLLLAGTILIFALASSFYFSRRKARKSGLPIWDHSSRKLLANLLIPLMAGGFFVFGLLYHQNLELITPACLVFYGMALVNASKYTLSDIRYIGFLEIALGIVNLFYDDTAFSIYFWAIGFGLLHIVYGAIMWLKYEWKSK